MVLGGIQVRMVWAAVGTVLIHVIGINGGNFCSRTFKMKESFAEFRSRRLSNVLVPCVYQLVFAHFARKFDGALVA